MKTQQIEKPTKNFIYKFRLSTLFLLVFAMVFQILGSVNSFGQIPFDSTRSKHIFFTQPLGYLLKDYSIGYEIKTWKNISYTIIVDIYKPWETNKYVPDRLNELEIYDGFSVRPGIKFLKTSGFYYSVEGFYKFSKYNDKFILREDSEGDAYDVYYLESRTCHSFGAAYKFGYEINKNHIFFSPFFSIGLRIRFDNIAIHGKYNYLGHTISDEKDITGRIWPIPIFRIGCLFGFGI
jgi:hypothetical protein